MARVGVVTFPGTCDDRDALRAIGVLGGEPVALWHGEADLHGVDAILLPGGFSYGDYLRCGAIARFSPVMASVADFAAAGGPVLGVCNGFQVLCEAGLLPGVLRPNHGAASCAATSTSRWRRSRPGRATARSARPCRSRSSTTTAPGSSPTASSRASSTAARSCCATRRT